jgi:hypothetical protein
MLNVIMLNVIMLNVIIMLNAVMLSAVGPFVILLSEFRLNVVALLKKSPT